MRLTEQVLRGPFDLAFHATTSRFVVRQRVLIACMPKSGSTFLSNAIGRLPGFRKTSLATHYGRTEQDLDASLALRKSRYNYVCQHHVRYNEKNRDVINRFSITPVVLVRDVHDCVISLRDHLRRESVDNSMVFANQDHLNLSDEELETFLVQMAIPWYINFYVSWHECPNALWITYQEVTTDSKGVIKKILRNLGRQDIGNDEIEAALENRNPSADRMNVGRPRRGHMLSEENKTLIRQYRSAYPSIDFSRIGVD